VFKVDADVYEGVGRLVMGDVSGVVSRWLIKFYSAS
jgi:hypothetical protein